MRPMISEEIDLIEAAREWRNMRMACHYGPGGQLLRKAESDLERAMDALDNVFNGQWKAPG